MKQKELTAYLDTYLKIDQFQDYCPNGLQVEGREAIQRLLTGVTANQALLEEAIKWKADAVLVHHGYFWKGESSCITGMKKRRLQLLLSNNINLFAYHLPLDAHIECGNNKALADKMGWQIISELPGAPVPGLGLLGKLKAPALPDEFIQQLKRVLKHTPLHIAGSAKTIERLAWCTGAADDWLHAAAHADVDAYITGEISERAVHNARELGVHLFAAGHHATERYGVELLGAHLAEKFSIEHHFVDIDCPV